MAARKSPKRPGSIAKRAALKPSALLREDVMAVMWPPRANVRGRRFTQDTPITPDVWYEFAAQPGKRQEVLLTPNRRSSVEKLAMAVRYGLIDDGEANPKVIYNQSHVLAKVTLEQLVRDIMPLSDWWVREIGDDATPVFDSLTQLRREKDLAELMLNPAELKGEKRTRPYSEDVLHMVRIVGSLALGRRMPPLDSGELAQYFADALDALGLLYGRNYPVVWKRRYANLVAQGLIVPGHPIRGPLFKVFINRHAESAVYYGGPTIKADAANQVFQISCAGLRWAVVDSGVDATHVAFGAGKEKDPAKSRISRTYDFTRLKPLLFNDIEQGELDEIVKQSSLTLADFQAKVGELQGRLAHGRLFDWELLEGLIRIRHDQASYRAPKNEHGTHVTGILAANWQKSEQPSRNAESMATDEAVDLIGICPDIRIYDLRVFDAEGNGDEFAILAALQFIRYLNANKDNVVVHGVNMSFSLKHTVDSYACGATPVCEECTRLSASGVVVVAAAGNRGFDKNAGDGFGNYQAISITDPGNCEDAITVGATHRQLPHKYGVSYFSSRGPTGDGRTKPDLVAPGEKIVSTIPGDQQASLDGTSMAAPYVSGAAALLMARHKELVGQPRKVKEILCKTATDLGRERSFQGNGLVDILRALQSV